MDAFHQFFDIWKSANSRSRAWGIAVVLAFVGLIGAVSFPRANQRVELEMVRPNSDSASRGDGGKTTRSDEKAWLEQVRKELTAAGIADVKVENGRISVPVAMAPLCRTILNAKKTGTESWAEEWERANLAVGQFSGSKERDTAREIARAKYVARLLRQLPDIEHADVVWDEDEVGWQSPRKARATVYLKPKAGQSITPEIVNAVRIAVAGSKRHLDPSNIVVLDMTRMTAYDGAGVSSDGVIPDGTPISADKELSWQKPGNLDVFRSSAITAETHLAGDVRPKKNSETRLAPRAYEESDKGPPRAPNIFDHAGIDGARPLAEAKKTAITSEATKQKSGAEFWEAGNDQAKEVAQPGRNGTTVAAKPAKANPWSNEDEWVNADQVETTAPAKGKSGRGKVVQAGYETAESISPSKTTRRRAIPVEKESPIVQVDYAEPTSEAIAKPEESASGSRYRFKNRRLQGEPQPDQNSASEPVTIERKVAKPPAAAAGNRSAMPPDWLDELDTDETATVQAAPVEGWKYWLNSPLVWCLGGGLTMVLLGRSMSNRGQLRAGESKLGSPDNDRVAHGPLTDFEEIRALPAASLSLLLENFPAGVWVAALAGASLETRRTVLSLLFADEADAILSRLEDSPPLRLRDIDEAQKKILAAARAQASQTETMALRR